MGNSKSTGKNKRASKQLEDKIIYALQELERYKEEHSCAQVSFNRIVLNFPKVQKTFQRMREVFNQFDKEGDGTLDYSQLKHTMARLHTTLNDEEIQQVFNEVDLYDDGKINFKEFITCIAVAYVLGMIPELEKGKPGCESKNLSPLRLKRSASTFYGASKSIADAFELAIDMYRGFDQDGKGRICQRDMEAVLTRAAQQSPSKRMRKSRRGSGVGMPTGGPLQEILADARWKEMDWDHTGTISFQEFIFTFVNWVSDTADEMDQEMGMNKDHGLANIQRKGKLK